MTGLANKYRPTSFKDVLGNDSIVKSLLAKLDTEDRPHTYLFTGDSGTGKTTIARIYAERLGADEEFIEEVNASADNGVSAARDLELRAMSPAIGNPIRVFIMDECHRMTKDAQNVLLKVMEEPPANVYFMFLTTEPESLINAFINRCTVYSTSVPSRRDGLNWLNEIVKEEGKDISDSVLRTIIKTANGVPRRCLTLLDSVIDLDTEDSMYDMIESFTSDSSSVKDLCSMLLKRAPWVEVSKCLKTLKGEPEANRRAILGYMSAVLLNNGSNIAADALDLFKENVYDSGKPGLVLATYSVVQLYS